jgi:hypothetical protein
MAVDVAVSLAMTVDLDQYIALSRCECEGVCECRDGLERLFGEAE